MKIFWANFMCLMSLVTHSVGKIQEMTEMPLVVPDPSMVRALKWLEKQRKLDYGFQDHTAEAVIVFQMANLSAWYVLDDFLKDLIIKQMDIEILMKLLRRHETFSNSKEFALYSVALNSLCRDPTAFYGHDLISHINHKEMVSDWDFGISSLAICISGTHVRKRQIRRLLDIIENQDDPIDIETISTVVIALQCINHDHRNRRFQHYLLNPTKKLGKTQKENGSFGNIKSSAFAIQALELTDPEGIHWNKSAAINYIKNQQNSDGSFGTNDVVYTTILVLMSLGPQTLIDIKDLNCQNEKTKNWSNPLTLYSLISPNKATENFYLDVNNTMMFEINSSKAGNWTDSTTLPDVSLNDSVTVSYSLWIGSNITKIYTINITTENNDSFYNVMQLAAQKDNHFSFLSTEWPNGHYVHTLAGYKEEPMSYHYWLLYKLPTSPDFKLPPPNRFVAPVGVDELLVEDGDHFLFWYKKL